MQNEPLSSHARTVGFTIVLLYILCLLYRVIMTDPAVANFHLLSLKTAFPGFQGYDVFSVIWGAVLSFIYGFVFSQVFHRLHKNCCGMK